MPGFGGAYLTQNMALYGYARNNPVRYVDADGNVFFIPIIIFIAKELAGEAFEQATGIPAPTIKNLGKGAIKLLAKKAGKPRVKVPKTPTTKIKPCSFSADTLVMTKEGLKPIAQIKEGDTVLARDEQSSKNVWREVVGVMTKKHDTILVLHFESEDGLQSEIITTDEHPFYVQNEGWVEAGKLKAGQLLETATGVIKLTSHIEVNKKLLAYDLTVDDAHTFFVGEQQVLVHNCLPTKKGSPVPGTGKGAGKAYPAMVKKGVDGPPKKLSTKPVKKTDAKREATSKGHFGGVIGSRKQAKKMGGRMDTGRKGGYPHGHAKGKKGHFWYKPKKLD